MNPNKKTLLPRKNGKTTLELKKFLREKYLGSDLHTLQDADKETPMKPIGDLDSVPHYRCPSCLCTVKLFDDSQCDKYCQHCGQAIDWSGEK